MIYTSTWEGHQRNHHVHKNEIDGPNHSARVPAEVDALVESVKAVAPFTIAYFASSPTSAARVPSMVQPRASHRSPKSHLTSDVHCRLPSGGPSIIPHLLQVERHQPLAGAKRHGPGPIS